MGNSISSAYQTIPLEAPLPNILTVDATKIFHGTSYDIRAPGLFRIISADQLFGVFSSLKFCDGINEVPFMIVGFEREYYRFVIGLAASPREGLRSRVEYAIMDNSDGPVVWFELDIGHGTSRHKEYFEWRDVGRRTWNLVKSIRYSNTPCEVVAVWASGLKYLWGQFEFRGSGASDQLGETFKLMALATAFAIEYDAFQTLSPEFLKIRRRRRYTSGDGGGGSGGGGDGGGGDGGGDGGGG